MATHAQTRQGLVVLSAGIGSLLLIAAAMVAGATAAENDDLVSVTPRAQSAEEKTGASPREPSQDGPHGHDHIRNRPLDQRSGIPARVSPGVETAGDA